MQKIRERLSNTWQEFWKLPYLYHKNVKHAACKTAITMQLISQTHPQQHEFHSIEEKLLCSAAIRAKEQKLSFNYSFLFKSMSTLVTIKMEFEI